MVDLTGKTLEKTWRIHRILAEGGMGRVYVASHVDTGQRAAVKVIKTISPDPVHQTQLCKAFEREAALLASLSHPAIVEVFETSRLPDGTFYLVQELVDGKTFEEELQADGPLKEEFAVSLTLQALDGLHYLHSQTPPVIVRDLTPRNLMISDFDDSVRIIDFGLAREVVDGQVTRQTLKGFGSEGFAPLEQYGAGTDQRSDLYSLGANLYFLLTGQVPVAAFNQAAGVEVLPLISEFRDDISEKTQDAIRALMQLKRDDRPSSAIEAKTLFRPPTPSRTTLSTSSPQPSIDSEVLSSSEGTLVFTQALSSKLRPQIAERIVELVEEALGYVVEDDDAAAMASLEEILEQRVWLGNDAVWAEVLQEIGTFMFFEGLFIPAFHFLERCIGFDDNNWKAHLSLSRLYLQDLDLKQSGYHLRRFEALAPPSAVTANL